MYLLFLFFESSPFRSTAYYVLECIEALKWNKGSDDAGSGGGMRTTVGNINANGNVDISSPASNSRDNETSIHDESTDNNDDERNGKINLIGHSMGAGVSVVLVAAFPELFESLTLLEGAGPLARNAKDWYAQVVIFFFLLLSSFSSSAK